MVIAKHSNVHIKGLIATAAVLLLQAFGVMAKGTSQEGVTTVSVGGYFPHFSAQSENTSSKRSRLIAKTHLRFFTSAFRPVDSATYIYKSGDRGGATKTDDYNNDESVFFDNSYLYLFDGVSKTYLNNTLRIQSYTADSKVQNLIYRKWHNISGSFEDSCQYTYSYAGDVMKQSDYYRSVGNVWTPTLSSYLTHDGNNNVTVMTSDVYKAYFTYDASNNITVVVDSLWSSTTGWGLHERKSYSYNGADVASYTQEVWSGGAWENSKKIEYSYTGSDITTMVEYLWDGSAWSATARNSMTYDTAHNKLTDVKEIWNINTGAFVNSTKKVITYNEFNQPTIVTTFSWSGNVWGRSATDEEYHFYYEYYFPTALHGLSTTDGLKIYPNPATNMLNIELQTPHSASYAIVDLRGTVVRTGQSSVMQHRKASIDVSDLPSGNYLLLVNTETEQIVRKVSITH